MLPNEHYLLLIAISYTDLFWSWDVRHTVIQPDTIACITEIVERRIRARLYRDASVSESKSPLFGLFRVTPCARAPPKIG
jgi:hypothetical protein